MCSTARYQLTGAFNIHFYAAVVVFDVVQDRRKNEFGISSLLIEKLVEFIYFASSAQ